MLRLATVGLLLAAAAIGLLQPSASRELAGHYAPIGDPLTYSTLLRAVTLAGRPDDYDTARDYIESVAGIVETVRVGGVSPEGFEPSTK